MGKIVDIVGTALFLGLVLRYGESASKLVAVSSKAATNIFGVVSLQGDRPSVGAQQITSTSYF